VLILYSRANQVAAPLVRTVPQPFNLHSAKKRKLSSADDKYETVAEQVVKFSTKTPERFHSRHRSLSRGEGGGVYVLYSGGDLVFKLVITAITIYSSNYRKPEVRFGFKPKNLKPN